MADIWNRKPKIAQLFSYEIHKYLWQRCQCTRCDCICVGFMEYEHTVFTKLYILQVYCVLSYSFIYVIASIQPLSSTATFNGNYNLWYANHIAQFFTRTNHIECHLISKNFPTIQALCRYITAIRLFFFLA